MNDSTSFSGDCLKSDMRNVNWDISLDSRDQIGRIGWRTITRVDGEGSLCRYRSFVRGQRGKGGPMS